MPPAGPLGLRGEASSASRAGGRDKGLWAASPEPEADPPAAQAVTYPMTAERKDPNRLLAQSRGSWRRGDQPASAWTQYCRQQWRRNGEGVNAGKTERWPLPPSSTASAAGPAAADSPSTMRPCRDGPGQRNVPGWKLPELQTQSCPSAGRPSESSASRTCTHASNYHSLPEGVSVLAAVGTRATPANTTDDIFQWLGGGTSRDRPELSRTQ